MNNRPATCAASAAVDIRTEHATAAEAARAAYRAVPPLPEIPDGTPHRNALLNLVRTRSQLGEPTRAKLADALPEIVAAWEAARPLLDDQAQAIARQAETLAGEYVAWWALDHDTRRATDNARPGDRRSEYSHATLPGPRRCTPRRRWC